MEVTTQEVDEWIASNDEESKINDEEIINELATEETADEDEVPVETHNFQMNTAAAVNFFRHLLFLLLILKIVGVFATAITEVDCQGKFSSAIILVAFLENLRDPIAIGIDSLQMLPVVTVFMSVVTCGLGFAGAVCFNSRPLLVFVTGMNCFFIMLLELTGAWILVPVINSLEKIVIQEMKQLFEQVNAMNSEYKSLLSFSENKILETLGETTYSYRLPLAYGWVRFANGSEFLKAEVDYIQTQLGCCGFTGRQFWKIRIPESCCPEKYPGDNCTLDVAYTPTCQFKFNVFSSCLSTLQVEFLVVAVLSFVTGCVAMRLVRYKQKYPDGNYASDDSSSSSEEDNVFDLQETFK
ncbi:uncharacterized protein LOC135133724 [Zophobas morio]|uniref:uncharacterized protein LOC135133724 n=1 Tax=Zophobas morio TaxID=2755281 RepID=UPI003083B14A